MKNHRKKKTTRHFIILLLGVVLFSYAPAHTQTDSGCPTGAVIEVKYYGQGMVFPRGEILYFMLCKNHVYYFDDVQKASARVTRRHGKLTSPQYDALLSVIYSAEFRALKDKYLSNRRSVDSFVRLTVSFEDSNAKKHIEIDNLLMQCKESFPQIVQDFICKIDATKKSQLKVGGNCGCK